jgi:hypothetical protein
MKQKNDWNFFFFEKIFLHLIQLMNKAIEQLHFDLSQHSFHQHITLIDQVLEINIFV